MVERYSKGEGCEIRVFVCVCVCVCVCVIRSHYIFVLVSLFQSSFTRLY